jgi:DNA-binding transcriptional LysR family regulator
MGSRRLAGTVRLTTVESAANTGYPALGLLRARHPDIRVEVITTDENLDLLRGDADLALRFGNRPPGRADRAPHGHGGSFYASQEMAERCGLPLLQNCALSLVLNVDRNGFVNNWVAEICQRHIDPSLNTLSG